MLHPPPRLHLDPLPKIRDGATGGASTPPIYLTRAIFLVLWNFNTPDVGSTTSNR
jgi:hypothetical protein